MEETPAAPGPPSDTGDWGLTPVTGTVEGVVYDGLQVSEEEAREIAAARAAAGEGAVVAPAIDALDPEEEAAINAAIAEDPDLALDDADLALDAEPVDGLMAPAVALEAEPPDAPDPALALPLHRRRPVLVGGLVGAAASAAVAAAAVALGDRSRGRRAAAAAAAGLAALGPALWAERRVTPLAAPRDEDGNVLLPDDL